MTDQEQTDTTKMSRLVNEWIGNKVQLVNNNPDYSYALYGPDYATDWRAFGSLLTVLAERGLEPKVSNVKSFVNGCETQHWIACIEVDFDTHGVGWFEEAAATPQLALLAATTKLIESVSNQETNV
jgi:hypothetical protein